MRDGFDRLTGTTDVAAIISWDLFRICIACIALYRWYDVVMPYMPLAAGNRVTLVAQHPTGSVLPQLNFDQISATLRPLEVWRALKRHGVEAAAGGADGELRLLPGAVLPGFPKPHRAARSRPSME